MSQHLIDVVRRLGHPRVLVVGDLILDRYVWGDAERVSQEAPVILLHEQRREARLGGAANVANMLRGLDAGVMAAGVVGGGPDGECLRQELEAAGIDCSAVIADPERPTTVKVRFIGQAQSRHPHQMLRVDKEVRTPVSGAIAGRLVATVLERMDEFDAVLFSDYAKGVCTHEIVRPIIEAARKIGKPVIVDPPGSGDLSNYGGVTAVTPNRLETMRATGIEVRTAENAFAAGRRLCDRLDLEHAFITLDRDGIALVPAVGEPRLLATRRREVYDITGAGDMVLAMIGVGAAALVDPVDLARLANVAGGLEVEHIGVVRVSREEIIADMARAGASGHQKLCTLDDLEVQIEAARQSGRRVVFTNGCFDLLHPGHVQFLEQAAACGDVLVVAVNSDDSVRKHKGPQRPIVPERDRAVMLAALQCVDYVLIFREDTPHGVLERLKPHVLVKGGTTPHVVARELVESYGGEVHTLEAFGGYSTTKLVEQIYGTRQAA
ncbi:MAG: bifunctional heptose 7-phosphate kinase/heptose 1-phosphate adenyltransferase [Planctomycetes bacterium]|nr:bifunctional heptose 7-phosphate kinase/heptose 1-phosphate adenyltransferase [Planctomycetota bacterium]